jgi:hypothetical protein
VLPVDGVELRGFGLSACRSQQPFVFVQMQGARGAEVQLF